MKLIDKVRQWTREGRCNCESNAATFAEYYVGSLEKRMKEACSIGSSDLYIHEKETNPWSHYEMTAVIRLLNNMGFSARNPGMSNGICVCWYEKREV